MRRLVIQTISEREGGNIYQRWESEPIGIGLSQVKFERLVKVAEKVLELDGEKEES